VNARAISAALAARPRQRVTLPGYAEAAVLVPLVTDGSEEGLGAARVLFTVRRADLRRHAGQISFPGGRRDAEDPDLVGTALREAEEELGIPRDRVEVLGLLDDVPTPSSFVVTPVVARVRGPIELVPQADEVASTFDAAIDELRDPSRYRHAGKNSWQGIEYVMHEYHVGEHRIWGATARMVHELLSLFASR
jgi:8-oxo-dGTP pyrophosphatase MutT (NUDIX family)